MVLFERVFSENQAGEAGYVTSPLKDNFKTRKVLQKSIRRKVQRAQRETTFVYIALSYTADKHS
jgi:hypothetical protein